MNFIVLITIAIVATLIIIYKFHNHPSGVTTVIAITLMLMTCLWHFTATEKGKRMLKDFTSNVSGGIPRQVKVYDINGKLIEEYEGRFDIETNHNNYILFDDESGLRHIIYFTTGSVIIDELEQ
ncbi:hypothetical protein AAK894_13460 [Lachnospiraceae bacterium 46-61]